MSSASGKEDLRQTLGNISNDKNSKEQDLPEDAVTPLHWRSLKTNQSHVCQEWSGYRRSCLVYLYLPGNLLSAPCCHHPQQFPMVLFWGCGTKKREINQ